MKKTFIAIISFLALIAASCSTGQKSQKRHHNDSTTLRLALLPTIDCLPFYVAADCGIYDSLGLDVEILPYRSLADCDTAFMRNHANCSVTDLIYALRNADTTDIRLIMQTESQWQIVTNRTARLRTTGDLKERVVAIARHSATDFLSDEFMKGTKLTHDDIFRPQVADVVLRSQMLVEGQIDAAILPEPYATRAVLLNNPSVYNSSAMEFSLTAIAARQSYASSHTKQLRQLIMGYNIAVERINKTHGEGRLLHDILVTRTLMEPEVADTMHIRSFKSARSVSTDALQHVHKWGKDNNLRMKSEKLGSIVNSDFLN